MKLLTDLISELSEPQPSLIDALVKTKVLLHRVGRRDLVDWVNNEINGYPDDAPLPSYRVIPAHVKGNVTNNAYSYSDHPLPTMHLTKEQRKRLEELEMRDSIAVLEGLAKHDTKGLQRPLPVEYAAFFNKALSGGYKVQQAWCDIGIGRFAQITAQVRSKLLDFLLDVSEKVGADMSDEAVKRVAQSPETGSMFNNAIFGDNVTILVGHNNQQTVRNSVERGDFDSLAAFLRAKQVQESDVAALQQAIAADSTSTEVAEKSFGPQTRSWLSRMMDKAINAAWQVEIGVAGGLLTNALSRYYGW
ncbi:MAG: response regulator receiver protein [Pseudomonadales bacterium]|nr:response regulator receiver protein [Pseudomonadales bacterium]MCP5333705.1 response regulator receiver protein [Pseudomonadales bacterium]